MESEGEIVKRWTSFWRELKTRTARPFGQPTYFFYFFTAVVILGGMGTWMELFSLIFPSGTPPAATAALKTSLVTFFSALAGSACMQMVIEEQESRSLRAFAFFVGIVSLLLALVANHDRLDHEWALFLSTVGSLVALWVWWVANANQKGLQDLDAPTGGSTQKSLSGNLDGYRVN